MSKYKIAIYLHMYDFQISGLFTKFICLGIKKWNQRKNKLFKKDWKIAKMTVKKKLLLSKFTNSVTYSLLSRKDRTPDSGLEAKPLVINDDY